MSEILALFDLQSSGLGPDRLTTASPSEELPKDLEEVKVLLEKSTRKTVRDTLTSEKSEIETEMKNKTQRESQKKPEPDNEKPAAVVVRSHRRNRNLAMGSQLLWLSEVTEETGTWQWEASCCGCQKSQKLLCEIRNYGWDKLDKFVKIYLTLTGVHQVPTENVQNSLRSIDINSSLKVWSQFG
ncbi:hypothetical protein STEG23_034946 [Scotinomys teguina]